MVKYHTCHGGSYIFVPKIIFGLYLPYNYASRIIFVSRNVCPLSMHKKTCMKGHICPLSMHKKSCLTSCLTVNILY